MNASLLPEGRCIHRLRGNAKVNANHTPRRAQHSWQAGQRCAPLPIFAKSRIVETSQKCLLGSSLIPLIQIKNLEQRPMGLITKTQLFALLIIVLFFRILIYVIVFLKDIINILFSNSKLRVNSFALVVFLV